MFCNINFGLGIGMLIICLLHLSVIILFKARKITMSNLSNLAERLKIGGLDVGCLGQIGRAIAELKFGQRKNVLGTKNLNYLMMLFNSFIIYLLFKYICHYHFQCLKLDFVSLF